MPDRPSDAATPMDPSQKQVVIRAFEALSPHDIAELLSAARLLHLGTLGGGARPLLRGKKLGLLSDSAGGSDADADLFCLAAVELGAHVAHIRPGQWRHSGAQEFEDAARMLGRLYDAVACQGLPEVVVARLRLHTEVPVYDGIASPHHPIARVAELLDEVTSPLDRRRLLLQAVLLSTIA